MFVPLRVTYLLFICASGFQLVASIQANNDIVGISSGYPRPWCIDVLSNDITTINTQITATTNGSGFAVVNASPVFTSGNPAFFIEADQYQILNERDGIYYNNYSIVNNAVWITKTESGASNDITTGFAPIVGYPGQSSEYGPAIGFNVIFIQPGTWSLMVRARRCNTKSNMAKVHAYSRKYDNSIDFITYQIPSQNFQTGYTWQDTTFNVAVNETYPFAKKMYLAMYSDSVCMDQIGFQYGSTSTPSSSIPPSGISSPMTCNSTQIMYYPPSGFIGVDTLTYTISDNVTSSIGTVQIYVGVAVPSPSRSPSPSASSSTSATPSRSPSPTPSRSPSPTPSLTPTPSRTPSTTPSPSVSPSMFSSPTPTSSVTPSISVSPSSTPSTSVTPSVTPTVTPTASATPSISTTPTPSISPSSSPFPPICITQPAGAGTSLFSLQPNRTDANYGQTFIPPVSGRLFNFTFIRYDSQDTSLNGTFYIFGNLQSDAGLGFGALVTLSFQITDYGNLHFIVSPPLSISPFITYTALIDNIGGEGSIQMPLAVTGVTGNYAVRNSILQNDLTAEFVYCVYPDSWPSPTPSSSVSATPSSTPSATPTVSPSSSMVAVSPSSSPEQESGNGGKKKSNSTATIGGIVGGVAGLSLCAGVVALFAFKRKRSEKKAEDNDNDIELNYDKPVDNSKHDSNYVPIGSEAGSVDSSERLSLSENLMIKYSDIKIEKEIGKGAYGVVFKGVWQGVEVAVKQMLDEDNDTPISEFFAEADLMSKLRAHPNITQLLGICQSPLCMVTEFVHNGSLWDWMKDNKMDHTLMLSISRGIATGMLYLHNVGVVHRDLAARNILLDKTLTPKITDFGMSRVALDNKTNKTASEIGPIRWMAPEAMRKRVYNKKTDVWSYGTVLYEIMTRKIPFSDCDLMQVAASVMMGELSLIPEIEKQENEQPALMVKVFKKCLKFEAEERPLFDEIVATYDHDQ